jgi:hypothetical protein
MAEVVFSRIHTELVNTYKVSVIADFAYGEYIATQNFFDKLSAVQQGIISTGQVTLDTGQVVDAETPGGLLAIQIYMESLESARTTMTGLSKLGLTIEKQVWKGLS